jgi:pyridoxamine 5'-phosphate oxidase
MKKEDKILYEIWNELNLSLNTSNHPFHIFSVSTIKDNKPDARNVVLRSVEKEKRTITFHTDKRSKKIKQIYNSPDTCALFYDQQKKIQLRIYGKISINDDSNNIKERWNKSRDMSKLCYLNKISPGDKISSSKEYLYEKDDLNNINTGINNFSIIDINIESIDFLNLNHKGHERIIFNFTTDNETIFNWVAP